MIEKLIIENFRSIKGEEIKLGPLNALIGPNNAGKSNIMRALNLVLGESYPTVRAFDEKDFCDYDKSRPVKITVIFESHLLCNPRVYGFQLAFDGVNCEYLAIGHSGDVVTYSPSGREVRVSTEMKSEVAMMYLGLDRQASQQIRATQWTLYGKLLKHIEKQIDGQRKGSFMKDITDSYGANIYPSLRRMETILKGHIKQQTGLDLRLRLSVLDPIETIKNLRPYLQEDSSGKEFDAEDLGAGTQSALAVAVARAYADIVNQPLVMAIEEPELYLHPHGCRHFYKLLKELSEGGVQIIYTTHERCFADVSEFRSVHVVRKESGETKVYSGIGKQVSSEDEIKLTSKFDEGMNEVFFANHAILVEGSGDKIACQLALENLGVQLDKESISIIECSSNTAIKPVSEILKLFGISAYALTDEDPSNPNTARIVSELRTALGDERVVLQSPNLETLFGLTGKMSKAEALAFFPTWFSSHEPPDVYHRLRDALSEES